MANINLWAVLTATVAAFLLGGIWYSPAVFCKTWCREAGVDITQNKKGHGAVVFGLAFVLWFIAAFVFAMFLGPKPSLSYAVGAGFGVGLCWVATSFGINYLFAGRSLKLFLIDAGYHTLQFVLYGVVLGLWH